MRREDEDGSSKADRLGFDCKIQPHSLKIIKPRLQKSGLFYGFIFR